MTIDFRLTSRQRALQLECREFPADVLANARAAEALPTPEERFCATKPVYEATSRNTRRSYRCMRRLKQHTSPCSSVSYCAFVSQR